MSTSLRNQTGNKYFSSFQHSMLNSLSYIGLSRFIIQRYKSNAYYIQSSSIIPKTSFYFLTGNTLVKLLYIIYLTIWKSVEMEFLDKMTLALYFLLFGIMGWSFAFWLRKYPTYGTIYCDYLGKINEYFNLKYSITTYFPKISEILHQFWTCEDVIFHRLGEPKKLQDTVEKTQQTTIWIYL